MDKVICIGSSSKDVFFPTGDGLILETPEDLTSRRKIAFELGAKFHSEDRFEALGGCAANVAGGLAKLGVETSCYTKTGDDQLGRWIIGELEKEGVDTGLVQIEKNIPSDLSAVIVDEKSGERIIFFNRDANENLEIIPKKLEETGWLFVSALNGNRKMSWKDNLKEILKIVEKGVKLAYNPGSENIKTGSAEVWAACRVAEVLLVNKDEALEIIKNNQISTTDSELDDEAFLVESFVKAGAKIVAVTDGRRGAWAGDGKNIFHAEAVAADPVETTGAGDAFSSGFLAAIIKGKNLEEALRWGIANGGSSVMLFGAHAGLLSAEKIAAESAKVKTTAKK